MKWAGLETPKCVTVHQRVKKPNSKITCTVKGPRWYPADLPQGGMKVPVKLKFTGKETKVNKLL